MVCNSARRKKRVLQWPETSRGHPNVSKTALLGESPHDGGYISETQCGYRRGGSESLTFFLQGQHQKGICEKPGEKVANQILRSKMKKRE